MNDAEKKGKLRETVETSPFDPGFKPHPPHHYVDFGGVHPGYVSALSNSLHRSIFSSMNITDHISSNLTKSHYFTIENAARNLPRGFDVSALIL